jgi:hypothetical protein
LINSVLDVPGLFHPPSQGTHRGIGKQREAWEVFVPQISGFYQIPDKFDEIKVRRIAKKFYVLHVKRLYHLKNQKSSLVTGDVHQPRNLASATRSTVRLSKSSQTTSALFELAVLILMKSGSMV